MSRVLRPPRRHRAAPAPGGHYDPVQVRATVDAAAQALGGLDIVLNTPFIAGHPDLLD